MYSTSEHEQFFREMLGDVEEPTAPYGLLDVRGDGGGIGEARVRVDEQVSRRIRAVARAAGVSAASVCHLAWGQVLSRLTGREEVVFGTVLFGRLHGGEGVEQGVGLYINTLPVRVSVGEQSVEGALRSTHERLGGLLQHEHASLTLAQRCSAVPAAMPLFTTLLNYRYARAPGAEERAGERLRRGAWKGITALYGEERTNYPLTLSVDDWGGGFALTAQVVEELDPRQICELMQTALAELVEALERSPSTHVRAIDVLPAAEREQLLVEWNRTEVAYPSDRCIHELFEEQVAKRPQATAAVYEEQSLSYAELNEQANRLAHYLRAQGVGPDTRVGICVERGLPMVVGLLGILKAGGAYVPLDPSYPRERLSYLLNDSGPVLLLVDGAGREALGEQASALPMIDLQADARQWAKRSSQNPSTAKVGLTSRHLAYVIYTSGSTGHPKGAMNEHRGVVNRLTWMQAQYALGSEDRVLQKTPFGFDVSVWEFFWPLLNGGRLIVARAQGHQDPVYLQQVIEEAGVTRLHFVPSMLQSFVERQVLAGCGSVKQIVCSGEELSVGLLAKSQERLPHVQVSNLYGPTEAAVDVTYWESRQGEELRRVPIGRPIANTQIYILDKSLRPVPVGVEGEIYIGGAGVARGYLNRPELTAERFIADPFRGEGQARLYRTGDLGRYRADGNIEFLGRNDQQVKIRGYRIELGEIEAKLAEHEPVEEAVVLAREDEPGEKRLVAYYTSRTQSAADVESLRGHLQRQLPEHMVPAAYVWVEQWPLTPNGKLDRKALPAPEGDAYAHQAYEAPQGEVEIALAQIWTELLGVELVGRHDNFFELGGHSLLAVTLIERMRQRGFSTDVRALFAAPTLRQLAEQIGRADSVAVPANLIPEQCDRITPQMLSLIDLEQEEIDRIVERVPGGARNVQDIYPLAPLQEGILFHHLMGGEGDAYVLSTVLAFDTRERLDRFLAALQGVIDRHDILRTAVMWEGASEPVQVVWRQARLPIEEVTLAAGDAVKQLRKRFDPRHYRLDVREAPLQRAFVARDLETDRWLLLLLTHHLTSDHTTLEVIFDEVSAHLLGEQDRLGKPTSFRNFVAQARLGITAAEHEQFFREMLGDVEESTAPYGLLDVRGDGGGIGEARVRVDEQVSRRIRAVARAAGVSAASVCHLAWGQVLSRLTGREEVVFGTVLFGRLHGGEGVEQGVGLYINTLPVRVSVGEQSVEGALRSTHERLGGLLQHEHASLTLAQRCSAVPAAMPLFTTLLNYRYAGAPGAGARAGERQQAWEGITALYGEERTNYPLTLSVDDWGGGFALTAQVVEELDPRQICELMQTALAALVEALERSPSTHVRAIDVLPAAQREQLLVEWNRTEVAYPSDRCIHELFEEQVEKAPQATAAVYEERSLSYAELNEQANRLAHYLRAQGVGPDTRVGICVERGLPMVVGLLGILKAGGAYVPLDPSYPRERLSYLLNDSGPVLLLVDGAGREALGEQASALPMIDLQADTRQWAKRSSQNPSTAKVGLTSRHLAYVIYTSGSTGHPKGAMNEHRGVVNRLTWMQAQYALGSEDRVLQKTPFGFDVSVWEFFWPLLNGGRLIVARAQGHQDPVYLQQVIEEAGVTRLHFVPSMLQSFVERQVLAGCGSVKQIVCSGEELSVGLLAKSQERLPHVQVSNLYGPTEAAVDVTYWESRQGEELRRVPIGRPIANTQIYILDKSLRPVPVGVEGEIYIGGAGVARGYLNRPELTAERFIADPFKGEGQARLYRTGDLGRYRADGNIEFLGRNDQQVKIRGYRIELGEIEAKLAEHEPVEEAVVLAREDEPGEKRLVAYYTSRTQSAADVESIRGHLQRQLPEHMVPAAYVWVEQWPLTPNGKLDRKALPAPEGDAYAHQAYEAPQGEVEIALAQIWTELLKVERVVGRHDNFFELGGHSLLAVRLQRELDMLGHVASLTLIFQYPTIKELAGHVFSTRNDRVRSESIVVLRDQGREAPLFLVHEVTGNVTCLVHLAQRLDSEIPVYGLQLTDASKAKSIEGLAAYHVKMVRAIQPEGPYRIAGYSFGGLIAYEMANQLLGVDQVVSFVGLIDTQFPRTNARPMDRAKAMAPRLLPMADDNELLKLEISDALSIAADGYCIEPLCTPVTLFNAVQNAGPKKRTSSSGSLDTLPWKKSLGDNVEILEVAGTHISMINAPHVDTLAEAMSIAISRSGAALDHRKDEYSPTVRLLSNRAATATIFCVPGAGAAPTCFLPFAETLAFRANVVGLQQRGLDRPAVPYSSVEAVARCFLESVRKIDPNGPYRFLGHSFGGWVAFEMARQLEALGRRVLPIILLDTDPPSLEYDEPGLYNRSRILMKFVRIIERSVGRKLGFEAQNFEFLTPGDQVQKLMEAMREVHLLPRTASISVLKRVVRVFAANLNTLYTPGGRLSAPVYLLQTDDADPDDADFISPEEAVRRWRAYSSNLTPIPVGGNHMTMLARPSIRAIADLARDVWSIIV